MRITHSPTTLEGKKFEAFVERMITVALDLDGKPTVTPILTASFYLKDDKLIPNSLDANSPTSSGDNWCKVYAHHMQTSFGDANYGNLSYDDITYCGIVISASNLILLRQYIDTRSIKKIVVGGLTKNTGDPSKMNITTKYTLTDIVHYDFWNNECHAAFCVKLRASNCETLAQNGNGVVQTETKDAITQTDPSSDAGA